MGDKNFINSNIYFKPANASDEEFQELKIQKLEISTIEVDDEPMQTIAMEEKPLGGSLEGSFKIKDKALIKMEQVKTKRLKKKYYKRTILYRLTHEMR